MDNNQDNEQPEVLRKAEILRDPITGEPLRNQDPGVPDSKWVGKHKIADVDGGLKEVLTPKEDFGDEEEEEDDDREVNAPLL